MIMSSIGFTYVPCLTRTTKELETLGEHGLETLEN